MCVDSSGSKTEDPNVQDLLAMELAGRLSNPAFIAKIRRLLSDS
jgi:hypothetical protein